MRPASLVLALAFATAVPAQACLRPAPPYGGFAPQFELVVPVTLSDGYQTFGTLIRPLAPAPSCGWPLVVFVHPLGQHRGFDQALQLDVVAQGYAVWTYDVRGHGQAFAANVGHPHEGSTLWGPNELLDLAEVLDAVLGEPLWAGTLDATRIAITGASQGGAHAWAAAARSGQTVTVAGRPPRALPALACIVAHDLAPDMTADWVRDGVLFSTFFTRLLAGDYASNGVPIDPGFLATGRAAFLAQDAAALVAGLTAEGRPTLADLLPVTVPVLYTHGYHDFLGDPRPGLEALASLSGPHRSLLGTGGHGTPPNAAERVFRDALTLRWFDRFLWNVPNEVELETPQILSELPLAAAERDDPASLWSRAHVVDPLAAVPATRWFLHDDLSLATTEPGEPQSDGVITQAIDPSAVGFDPAGYLDLPAVRDLANVLQVCPLSERVYACTTTAESELTHAARVHLRLVPDRPEWMLAALLTVQPAAPGAAEVMLASRAIASRTSVANQPEDREFTLPPIAVRIPAGATVRLRLRNLWLDEAPAVRQLMAAPRFHDFQVAVVHSLTAGGSWLDLPLQPVRPRLVATTASLDLATLPPYDLTLRAGSVRAGLPYMLAVGLSGQVPATTFLGETVPIEPDWLVGFSAASMQVPWFFGFLGALDATGDATGTLDLSAAAPMQEWLAGWSLTTIGFVWDAPWAPSGAASNAVDVRFR
ncbi:MAG: alpha/beta fold hydrolase [Planctomycetes bacterium]|nr:alpha/beta fold hydrolase [Planctomycetota bacterium]